MSSRRNAVLKPHGNFKVLCPLNMECPPATVCFGAIVGVTIVLLHRVSTVSAIRPFSLWTG